jgi:hypothetical protein
MAMGTRNMERATGWRMMKSKLQAPWVLAVAALIHLSVFGQTGLSQSQPSTPSQNQSQNQMMNSAPNIAIGAGDLLNVVVFDTPELTTSVRVSQDGEINLPVLGLIRSKTSCARVISFLTRMSRSSSWNMHLRVQL